MDIKYLLCGNSGSASRWDSGPEEKDTTEKEKEPETSPPPGLEPSSLTKFPARQLPDPRTAADWNDRPVRAPASCSTDWKVGIDRWYCCKCVEGDASPGDDTDRQCRLRLSRHVAGMIYSETGCRTKCDECGHQKCHNCGLGSAINWYSPVSRTVGGLHVSPRHVDPVYWECICGEWECNRFNAACVFDDQDGTGTACSSKYCRVAGPWGSPRVTVGRLTRTSVVLNQYGQRLGTADQSVMVAEGPWHCQRRALGDRKCALLLSMRPRPFRVQRTMSLALSPWEEGECAPEYPERPGPPDPILDDRNDGATHYAYEGVYLEGMPVEPTCKGKGKDVEGDDGHDLSVDMVDLEDELGEGHDYEDDDYPEHVDHLDG